MYDPSTVRRNSHNLVLEVFWAAIFIGCLSFLAAFTIRLGGSNFLVSLLTSGAALINAVCSVPFARFLARRTNRRPWILGSLLAFRLGHIAFIFIPWLPMFQPEAIVVIALILNIGVALFNAGWLPMFADMLPIQARARVFSARNMTLGATTMVTTFIMGAWLDLVPFPINYQLMFVLAIITSLLSTLYVARLSIPASTEPPPAKQAAVTHENWRSLLRKRRSYVNITVNTLIFNLPFWMALPLQPIYFVRDLNASDGWIGIWVGLLSGGAILGNLIWRRLIDKFGLMWVLLRAMMLSSIYYALIGLFPDLNLILVFAFLFGMISPGVDVAHFSVLLEICPAEQRTLYLSVFVTIMNIGLFLAPLAIAPLLDLLGAQILLLAMAGVRLFGALLFVINPVRLPEPQQLAPT
jgi:MFS family permease